MKNIITAAFLITSSIYYTQVGINTESPQAVFHITEQAKTGYNVNNGVIETPHNKVGLKIPTHNSFPNIPNTTALEKELSKNKNGMLIHLDRPANTNRPALQGFYYWDNNNLSWENIIDTRETTIDDSKTIIEGAELAHSELNQNIKTSDVKWDEPLSPDENFSINEAKTELIIPKTADYYILVTGSMVKTEGEAMSFTLDIITKNSNNQKIADKSLNVNVAVPASSGDDRTANFYISKVLTLDKNSKISATVTGVQNTASSFKARLQSPISITFIKMQEK